MKRIAWVVFFLVGGLSFLNGVSASHLMGGSISFAPKAGSPDFYTIRVFLYYDTKSTDPESNVNQIIVSIFQKSNNRNKVSPPPLNRVRKEPLAFVNQGCADSRNAGMTVVEFSGDVKLSKSDYNDSQGYYISKELCCLSGAVSNIQGGFMVLYTEFPPLSTINSSPVFEQPVPEIMCRNSVYSFANTAIDADGDVIRYRLETPFGSANVPNNGGYLSTTAPGPYPSGQWKSGFSLANTIPGAPSLSLQALTGTATVKPTQTGLFVYRVVAEEYRNGRKIGEVHRDFQVYVIDCPDTNPPPVSLADSKIPEGAEISVNGDVTEVRICIGDTLFFKAEDTPEWAYQWKRNGTDIPGGNKAAISLWEEGVYTVSKTFAERCGTASAVSEKFQIIYRSREIVSVTPGPDVAFCAGDKVTLSTGLSASAWAFEWKHDGTVQTQLTSPVIIVKDPGMYTVIATNRATNCKTSDTVRVTQAGFSDRALDFSATTFCEGDSLKLQAVNQTGVTYKWFRNGQELVGKTGASLQATVGGTYYVEMTVLNSSCSAFSDTIELQVNRRPVVLFDTIPPSCGQGNAAVPLTATPVGGVFSGKGVVGDQFNAVSAGIGSHTITYSYSDVNGCEGRVTRIAAVNSPPSIELPASVFIESGSSVTIDCKVTGATMYTWSPPDNLSDPTIMQPVASPVQKTTYVLRAENDEGCYSEKELVIDVYPKVEIPNAFTPNGDAVNQTWELKNIAAYPDCVVEVFNRWGSRVFRSQGYSEAWDGAGLPTATYYYKIKLNSQLAERTGTVSIFR